MLIVSIREKDQALQDAHERNASKDLQILSIRDRLREKSLPLPEKGNDEEIIRIYAQELLNIIREEDPECIHVHYAGLLRYVERIRFEISDIPIFFTCHGKIEGIFGKEDSLSSQNARILIRENDMKIIALHEEMKRELQERFGESNVVVINNGIPLQQFRFPHCDREKVRSRLGIPQDAFVLGHVGMFIPLKNHDFLVRIFVEMVSKSDKAFLLMAGRGETVGKIQYLLDTLGLSDRYLRIPSCIEIPELLTAMDVFAFPSSAEGFPMALLEAQAAGLPCVKSDGVPDEAMVTWHIVSKSLKDPISEWCDLLLHPDRIVNNNPVGDIEDYDTAVAVQKLDRLYRGEDI